MFRRSPPTFPKQWKPYLPAPNSPRPPAQSNRKLLVNTDNGYAVFTGDANSSGAESLLACDTKSDGYAIIALLDIDADGSSDIRVDTKGLGSNDCRGVAFNVAEGHSMNFWACQINGDNFVNCTSRVAVTA